VIAVVVRIVSFCANTSALKTKQEKTRANTEPTNRFIFDYSPAFDCDVSGSRSPQLMLGARSLLPKALPGGKV
jgi:hypothetical protein